MNGLNNCLLIYITSSLYDHFLYFKHSIRIVAFKSEQFHHLQPKRTFAFKNSRSYNGQEESYKLFLKYHCTND